MKNILGASLRKERGSFDLSTVALATAEDQPQGGVTGPMRWEFGTCCGWSRTTQPRSGVFRQVPGRPHCVRLESWFILVGLLLVAGLVPQRVRAQGTLHTVHIYNFDFSLNPAGEAVVEPVIEPGDTVRWVWDQGFHSTTAAANQLEFWDSGVLSSGTFEHLFSQPGEFSYFSRTFGFDNGDGTAGGMSGTVFVVPEPGAAGVLGLGLSLLALRQARCR